MIPEVYRKLGVRPVIHGSGTTTRYGGSRLSPGGARVDAPGVDRSGEHRRAQRGRGRRDRPHARRGGGVRHGRRQLGLILQAAACIAGDDPAKITRLPDTCGLPNEIVIQRAQPLRLRPAYRVAGGALVEIGLARRTQPSSSRTRITEKTAAVAY